MLSQLLHKIKGDPKEDDSSLPPRPLPSFQSDNPFPCLACAPGAPQRSRNAGEDDEDDQALAADLQSFRASSHTRTGGDEFADYPLNPQHRRDQKEGLPPPLSRDASATHAAAPNLISEAVIGSLPKGLTATEKAALAGSLPLSPLQTRISSGSLPALTGRFGAPELRLAALKGAVVAFVTAGYSGKRFVFERAAELGVRVVVLDGPDTWSKALPAQKLAEKFIPIDFSETHTVFDRCLEALQAVQEDTGLDGVVTFNEFAVPLVARLAERLGLPGNPPSACDAARDKQATRRIMEAAGLPSPKTANISRPEDVGPAAAKVGFPAVVKPVSAAASMGVVRVDSLEELERQVTSIGQKLALLYLDDDGNLREAEEGTVIPEAMRRRVAQGVNATLLLEEYLDGGEVDCDLVLSDGVVTYGAITDNWPTIEPYFNETGSNCPSVLPYSVQKDLMDLAVASCQVLGFTMGVFHVESKATSRGARLIEVNARMGGGGVRDINRLVWGVDLVEQQLLVSCGVPARPAIARRPLAQLAEYSINAPVTGTIQRTDFLDPWVGLPDTIYARPLVQPGDKVVSSADGMPTWVCEVAVTKPTVEEAIEYVKSIENEIKFVVEPLPVAS